MTNLEKMVVAIQTLKTDCQFSFIGDDFSTEEHFNNITPSYISIDTEGSEYEILKSLNIKFNFVFLDDDFYYFSKFYRFFSQFFF